MFRGDTELAESHFLIWSTRASGHVDKKAGNSPSKFRVSEAHAVFARYHTTPPSSEGENNGLLLLHLVSLKTIIMKVT